MFEAYAFGPFIIWTRVVFLLLGIWLTTEFLLRLSRSAHLSLQHFQTNAWRYVLAFAIGGRIAAIIADYRVYQLDPLRVFVFWDGGFSFLGAAVGVTLVLNWLTRHHRATFLQWLDVITPAVCFGMGFEWLGKFTAGASYGRPTDVFWAITYDGMNVRYVVPIHPVQLYYAAFFFILTFLLLVIRKNAKRAGAETLFGIVMGALATFFLEYFRGDFSKLVFASQLDFVLLTVLFASLGIFAVIELKLSKRAMYVYEGVLLTIFGGYLALRPHLLLPTIELRFTQFIAVLALLGTVVYVVVHRRKYPHL